MNRTRTVSLCFVMALLFAPLTASAQGSGSTNALQARVQALEAAVTALQNGLAAESAARAGADSTLATTLANESAARASADSALGTRTDKLEGTITAADLVGTYHARGVFADLDGGGSPEITHIALNGVATLRSDGTGTIAQSGAGISLVGPVWTDSAFTFPEETINITWTYASGFVHITDGTVNLDIDFAVGAGGRVLIYSGLSDDNSIDIVVATRLR